MNVMMKLNLPRGNVPRGRLGMLKVPVKARERKRGKHVWRERYVFAYLPSDFPDVDEVIILTPDELKPEKPKPVEEPDWSDVEAMIDVLMPEDKNIKVVGDYVIVRYERLEKLLDALGWQIEHKELPWPRLACFKSSQPSTSG